MCAALQQLASYRGRQLDGPDPAVNTVRTLMHGFLSLTMPGRIAGERSVAGS